MPARTQSKTSRPAGGRGRKKAPASIDPLPAITLDAAGIDVGSTEHVVAVPPDRDPTPVRTFGTFTGDLVRIADWLASCGVRSVAMEATGVYWIPVFELLEERGFEVKLVNARHVKNVSGRKSDVLDAEWLRQLESFGLLAGAFRPADQICVLRSYLRQRAMLVQCASSHILHMQKALQQMNVLLHTVVTNITGTTGLAIIRAILAGEQDPQKLAALRDPRCKNDAETIARSLEGTLRQEHLFALRQALELYEVYVDKIAACDDAIDAVLRQAAEATPEPAAPLPPSTKKYASKTSALSFDVRSQVYRMTGVDLTQIDGISEATALVVVSEIGTDVSKFPTEKHFASWLGLCPGTRISGGKVLSSRTKPSANRVATALRLAAHSLHRSQSALGAFLRRKKAQLGAPKAITATAHKLARLIYRMLKYGTAYVDTGQAAYEQQFKERTLKSLTKKAKALGFELVAVQAPAS